MGIEDAPPRSGCWSLLGLLAGFLFVLLLGFGLVVSQVSQETLDRWKRRLLGEEPVVAPDSPISPEDPPGGASPEPEAIDASKKSARLGSVRLSVRELVRDHVRAGSAGGPLVSNEPLLMIRLQIENLGDTEITVQGWGVSNPNLADVARLWVVGGASVSRVTFAAGAQVPDQIGTVTLAPGKSTADVILFDLPPSGTANLRLDLPARHFGAEGVVRFLLPRSMITDGPPPPPPDPDNPRSVSELIEVLRDPDPRRRRQAVQELAIKRQGAKEAIPTLATLLRKDRDPLVRADSAMALGKIGMPAHTVLGAVLHAIGEDDDGVRRAAQEALPKLGAVTPADGAVLVEVLENAGREARLHVAKILEGLMLRDEELKRVATRALGDTDAEVRRGLLVALSRARAEARPILWPLFSAALQDADAEARRIALAALQALGQPGTEDLPWLRRGIQHSEEKIRLYVLEVLLALGGEAHPALGDLVEALGHADPATRRGAAVCLIALGDRMERHQKALVAALKDVDLGVRKAVLETLGNLGPEAAGAAQVIAERVTDADPAVRLAATTALMRVDRPLLLKTAVHCLHKGSLEVRREAAETLAALGPRALEAFPELIVASGDMDPGVQARIARAMARLDPANNAPLKILCGLLEGTDADLCEHAAETLTMLKDPDLPGIPEVLGRILHKATPEVRSYAISVLARLGTKARPAVVGLVALLEDRETHEKVQEILDKIGLIAIPELEKGLTHESPGIREGAATTLALFALRLEKEEAKRLSRRINRSRIGEKDPRVDAAKADAVVELEKVFEP